MISFVIDVKMHTPALFVLSLDVALIKRLRCSFSTFFPRFPWIVQTAGSAWRSHRRFPKTSRVLKRHSLCTQCAHVFMFLQDVADSRLRNPPARCGQSLQLAQEMSDRPFSDLDSGTKEGMETLRRKKEVTLKKKQKQKNGKLRRRCRTKNH